WHAGMVDAAFGWNFAIWGALNGVYVVLWSAFSSVWAWAGTRRPRLRRLDNFPGVYTVQALLTFHLVLVSWVFFRAASTSDALTVITRVYDSLGSIPMLARFYDFSNFDFRLSIILILFLLV